MSGVVFHHIAEGVMARHLRFDVSDAKDSSSVHVPDVKNGNILAADYVLKHLQIPTQREWSINGSFNEQVWGTAESNRKQVTLNKQSIGKDKVPNVVGMGARDAVYLLENVGLRVRIEGRGKVEKQSSSAGTKVPSGAVCVLTMR